MSGGLVRVRPVDRARLGEVARRLLGLADRARDVGTVGCCGRQVFLVPPALVEAYRGLRDAPAVEVEEAGSGE